MFGEYLLRNISPMASVPSSEVEAGPRRRHSGIGARTILRGDDVRSVVRSVARVEPRLRRRRCHRRDGESESDQLDGEPLPAFHLNSLSRVFCHISTVRRAWVPVVRSRDSRSVKLLIERGSGSYSRACPRTTGLRSCGHVERHGQESRKPKEEHVSPKRPKPVGAAKKLTAPAKPKKQKKTSRGK